MASFSTRSPIPSTNATARRVTYSARRSTPKLPQATPSRKTSPPRKALDQKAGYQQIPLALAAA